MTLSDESLLADLSLHRQAFDELVGRARAALLGGRPLSAAGLLSMAADVAARNHMGSHVDSGLERLLFDLAKVVPVVDAGAEIFDVVHLVGSATTRGIDETVSRWSASGGTHSTVVTTPDEKSLLDCAARVRSHVLGASLVVVHTEPDDIVAMLALGGLERRPPVVHVNHHEWVFWPGVGIADVVTSHLAVGSAISVERRLVPPGRALLLPPMAGDVGVWSRELGAIEHRARQITPAVLPPPVLPRIPGVRDLEVARMQQSAGRSDGMLGAYHRHGEGVAEADRPELSVVVLGLEPDDTIDCLHGILETWLRPSRPQLIVVDRAGTPEMAEVLGELGDVVRVARPTDPDEIWSVVSAGLQWAWGPYAAIIGDEAVLTDGCWDIAIDELDGDPSRVFGELPDVVGGRTEGLVLRVDAGSSRVEHAFATLPSAQTLFRRDRGLRLASLDGSSDFSGGDHR